MHFIRQSKQYLHYPIPSIKSLEYGNLQNNRILLKFTILANKSDEIFEYLTTKKYFKF